MSEGPNTYEYVGNSPLNWIDPYGLAQCTYSITEHKLTCTPNNGGTPVVLGPTNVWSGQKGSWCQNNPSPFCTDLPYIGPIPIGDYDMNKDPLNRPLFWQLQPNPDRGWRSGGFLLHPGTISAGCITVERNDPNAMKQLEDVNALLLEEDGDNKLKVKA